MLNQILVLSASGLCYVHRSYNDYLNPLDPQLISAMAAVESFGGAKLSDITKILREESNNNADLDIDIVKTHNYIACAISSRNPQRDKLQSLLPRVNQMVYETMGNPTNKFTIEASKISQIEHKLDLMLIRSGQIKS